jgi:DNA-binding beta-propeller fold protein YncE
MNKSVKMAMLATPMALVACAGHDGGPTSLPTAPPSSVAKVASGNFTAPTDAVASLDGKEFYFAAFDANQVPGLWSTSSAPGSTATEVASGGLLDMPIGMVLSCDGDELYIADLGTGDQTTAPTATSLGAILTMPVGGGTVSQLNASDIVRPEGLAMGPDCKTLYVTGHTADGTPALFTVPAVGGAASIVWSGAPLVSPTGLHVDTKGVAWVMDHLAVGQNGEGVLYAIPSSGASADEVISNIHMGTPGGVSLTAGGGTAVIPTINAQNLPELTTVDISSGEVGHVAATGMMEPAGLRTAREAGVFAVVDAEGAAIYRAE